MQKDLEIKQGATFNFIVRWETSPIVYKAISAVVATTPLTLTVSGHGAVDGWSAAITGMGGMTQANASKIPPRASDYHKLTYIDANTIAFNDINAVEYDAYTSGGYIQYNTPQDLAGYTARMKIKNRKGGTVLHTLTTENGGIALDNSAKTITLTISATDTAGFTWRNGVFDLELVSAGGVVTEVLSGNVYVETEVTT